MNNRCLGYLLRDMVRDSVWVKTLPQQQWGHPGFVRCRAVIGRAGDQALARVRVEARR